MLCACGRYSTLIKRLSPNRRCVSTAARFVLRFRFVSVAVSCKVYRLTTTGTVAYDALRIELWLRSVLCCSRAHARGDISSAFPRCGCWSRLALVASFHVFSRTGVRSRQPLLGSPYHLPLKVSRSSCGDRLWAQFEAVRAATAATKALISSRRAAESLSPATRCVGRLL